MSWPLVRLGDCCTVVGGATPKREKSEYWDSPDIPWVTPKDVSNLSHPVLDDAPEYISELGYKSCSAQMLPEGAILLTSRAPIGNVAIAGRAMCTNQGFKSLVPGKQVFGPFLYHCVKHYSAKLESLGNGATFKEVSKKIVEDFEIPLPPLEEQKRIAAILDKADAIRRKRQQAIKLADDFLRSVFLEMFGDPVINPKRWEVRPAKKVLKITGGYAFSSDDFGSAGIPVVKIGNANKVGFTAKNIDFIVPENVEKFKQFELYPGDLLMSLTGTVGKDDYGNVTEVTNEYPMYYLNQRVAKIEVGEAISKNYLRYFLANEKVKSHLTKNNRGVRQANISNSDVYDLSIPIPDSIQLERFDLSVARLQSMLVHMSTQYSEAQVFFNALSQKAFSGIL